MQNIHVRRVDVRPTLHGVIEPEDKSWMLVVTDKGPELLIRTKLELETMKVEHGYINVRDVPDLSPEEIAGSTFCNPCDAEGRPLVGMKNDPDAGATIGIVPKA